MATGAADLPNPFIRFRPCRLEKSQHRHLQRPGVVVRNRRLAPREVECVHDFAEDVQLSLIDRRVPDAHGRGAFEPWKPWELNFSKRRSPLAPYMICNCEGSPATARSSQSRHAIASSLKPQGHERIECERGVAEPAVPIVPVPHAPNPFGKRRRRRRDDAASRGERQRLQCDRGPQYFVAPRSVVGVLGAPIAPPRLGIANRFNRVRWSRRWTPGMDARPSGMGSDRLPDGELRDRGQPDTVCRHL